MPVSGINIDSDDVIAISGLDVGCSSFSLFHWIVLFSFKMLSFSFPIQQCLSLILFLFSLASREIHNEHLVFI